MTEINIAELREKIARATPAPWTMDWNWEMVDPYRLEGYALTHTVSGESLAEIEPQITADRLLAEAAVNNLTALCDEVERLRKVLEMYADKGNWLDIDDELLSSFCSDDFDWGWQAARKALGKDE